MEISAKIQLQLHPIITGCVLGPGKLMFFSITDKDF